MQCTWSTHPDDFSKLTTAEIRERFVAEDLFAPGEFRLAMAYDDRMVIGGVCPTGTALKLEPPDELRAEYFLERRELAVVGLSGDGTVEADGALFTVSRYDVLYLPMGTKSVTFSGSAVFYIVSARAHRRDLAALASRDEAEPLDFGSRETFSRRTIRKYIHSDGIKSNELLLGITELAQESTWNSMPPHLHARRTEIYLYDDLADGTVVHLMGTPSATRQLILGNRQAVVSPPWSIHCGSGTGAYSYVWAMAGENIEYSDSETIDPRSLR
jgi:4-deoxy-L-threo-5-hexosulose-uronate ketol-isomerase